MKIKDFTPPNRAEVAGVPKDAKWLDDYMSPIFDHIKDLTRGLQGKLSSENLNEEVKTINVRHQESVEVKSRVKGKPLGASLVAFSHPCSLLEAQPIDIGLIRITIDFDDAETEVRTVTILVKGA